MRLFFHNTLFGHIDSFVLSGQQPERFTVSAVSDIKRTSDVTGSFFVIAGDLPQIFQSLRYLALIRLLLPQHINTLVAQW